MLELKEYQLYGRQMVLNGFGLTGQLKLQQAGVAIVGAGGLGCPALQYLGAAGIGKIAIIDHDIVELSNLQRQILHSEKTIGWNKAKSAAHALSILYPRLDIDTYEFAVTAENALELLRPYDLVLDCTDNPATRYLLSDATVLLDKPLISGAAQRYDGQLCTYNLGTAGPCYRCLFPKPAIPKLVSPCEETGILGAVTGIIGNLQALEAIKILIGLHGGIMNLLDADMKPSLLLFSAVTQPPFRTVKLRPRKEDCPACGVAKPSVLPHTSDYVQFCSIGKLGLEMQGHQAGDPQKRVTAKGGRIKTPNTTDAKSASTGIRDDFVFRIPGFTNVPLDIFISNPQQHIPTDPGADIYIVCRLGNDSQIAVEALQSLDKPVFAKDIIGGLKAWAKCVDKDFPVY